MKALIESIQNFLNLRRAGVLTVNVPLQQARIHLRESLSQEIMLSGNFRVTRWYWGTLSNDSLVLHGPRAHRQFCFVTRGKLIKQAQQTHLEVDIRLSRKDSYSLLLAIAILIGFLLLQFHIAGLVFAPFFLTFIYGMTQLHFQYYSHEIKQLLVDMAEIGLSQ